MLGPRQQLEPRLFYTAFNLEGRVPPEHPLRAIARGVDFGFVRQEVAGLYGKRGNPSVDPTVLAVVKLSASDRALFAGGAAPGQLKASAPTIPEPHGSWVDPIEREWTRRYGQG